MPATDLPPSGATRLARTAMGQAEALRPQQGLSPAQRRLLLLVNGFTPLSALAAHLPAEEPAIAAGARLLAAGLVEAVGASCGLAPVQVPTAVDVHWA